MERSSHLKPDNLNDGKTTIQDALTQSINITSQVEKVQFQKKALDFQNKLWICPIKSCLYKGIDKPKQVLHGSGFLYQVVIVDHVYFGVFLTAAHIFHRIDMEFSSAKILIKAQSDDLTFKIRRIFLPKEYQQLIKSGNFDSQYDFAFAVVVLNENISDPELANTCFGQITQKFETEAQTCRTIKQIIQEGKQLPIISPFRLDNQNFKMSGDINLQVSEMRYIENILPPTGFDDNLNLKIQQPTTNSFAYILNSPSGKGSSGAVIGFISEQEKKFFPVGIHTAHCDGINQGRLIEQQLIDFGIRVVKWLNKLPVFMGNPTIVEFSLIEDKSRKDEEIKCHSRCTNQIPACLIRKNVKQGNKKNKNKSLVLKKGDLMKREVKPRVKDQNEKKS